MGLKAEGGEGAIRDEATLVGLQEFNVTWYLGERLAMDGRKKYEEYEVRPSVGKHLRVGTAQNRASWLRSSDENAWKVSEKK